jgi:hypothetical protein
MTLRRAITLIRRVRIVSSFRIGPAIDQRSLSGIAESHVVDVGPFADRAQAMLIQRLQSDRNGILEAEDGAAQEAARTVTTLMKLIGKLIKTFATEQCANYFRHAGYASRLISSGNRSRKEQRGWEFSSTNTKNSSTE